MKKLILLCAVIACTAISAHAQPGPVPQDTNANKPVITFESETIDFGTVNYDSDGNREFKFKNTGKSPLVIKDVIKSCGCTTPAPPPKDPILPGQTGVIKFHYDTKRVGMFEKTITIVSNSTEPNKVVHFKGTVLPQKQ